MKIRLAITAVFIMATLAACNMRDASMDLQSPAIAPSQHLIDAEKQIQIDKAKAEAELEIKTRAANAKAELERYNMMTWVAVVFGTGASIAAIVLFWRATSGFGDWIDNKARTVHSSKNGQKPLIVTKNDGNMHVYDPNLAMFPAHKIEGRSLKDRALNKPKPVALSSPVTDSVIAMQTKIATQAQLTQIAANAEDPRRIAAKQVVREVAKGNEAIEGETYEPRLFKVVDKSGEREM